MSKLLSHPAALTNIVRRIAIEAGDIILDYYDMPDSGQLDDKGDGSPVTLADREAEALIKKKLAEITPDVPFVGEETVARKGAPDLSGSEYYWCVDPLDGTKEFINDGDDFTVNIALIHRHKPFLGVVFVPVTGVLYAGYENTAFKWSEDTGKEKTISVRPPPARGLTVVSSKSHGVAEKRDVFLEQFKVDKIVKRGSSLKMCIIAEGKADIYPRFGPTCLWDTAAGHAILNAAGGNITDMDGQTLGYDPAKTTDLLNPDFVASGFDWMGED
jgi:3'(2'), 5'-bisphosphate nucleotidase